MKTVEVLKEQYPSFRIKIEGAPPLRGWAVQYVSGIDNRDPHESSWLSQWTIIEGWVTFAFDSEVHMVFPHEEAARSASSALRQAEIETRIIHLP